MTEITEKYHIGDVLFQDDEFKMKRIVLKEGDWGCRLSCTQQEGTKHFETHHLKGKCHLASLWSYGRIKANKYIKYEPKE